MKKLDFVVGGEKEEWWGGKKKSFLAFFGGFGRPYMLMHMIIVQQQSCV